MLSRICACANQVKVFSLKLCLTNKVFLFFALTNNQQDVTMTCKLCISRRSNVALTILLCMLIGVLIQKMNPTDAEDIETEHSLHHDYVIHKKKKEKRFS